MDIAPIVKLSGDRKRAADFRGFALTQLQITKDLMKFSNLEQYKRQIVLAGGVVITSKVQFGLSRIEIHFPTRAMGQEEEELFRYDFAIIPFYHESADDETMEAHFIQVQGWKRGEQPRIKRLLISDDDWTIPNSTPFVDNMGWTAEESLLGAVRSFVFNKTGDDVSGQTVSIYRATLYHVYSEWDDILSEGTSVYLQRCSKGGDGTGCIAQGMIIDPETNQVSQFSLTARLINNPSSSYHWVELKLICPQGTFTEDSASARTWYPWACANRNPEFRQYTIGWDGTRYNTDCELIGDRWSWDADNDLIRYTPDKTWDYDPVKRVTVSRQFNYTLQAMASIVSTGTQGDNTWEAGVGTIENFTNAVVRMDFIYPTSSGYPVEEQGSWVESGVRLRHLIDQPDPTWQIQHAIGEQVTISYVNFLVVLHKRLICYYDWTDDIYPWKFFDRMIFFDGSLSRTGTSNQSESGIITSKILDHQRETITQNTEAYSWSLGQDGSSMFFGAQEYEGFTDSQLNQWRDYSSISVAGFGWLMLYSLGDRLPMKSATQMKAADNNTRIIHSFGTYVPDLKSPLDHISYSQVDRSSSSDTSIAEFDARLGTEKRGSHTTIRLLSMPRKDWRWVTNARGISLSPDWEPVEE